MYKILVMFFLLSVSYINSFDIIVGNFSNVNYSIKIEKDGYRILEINNFENGKISKSFKNLDSGKYLVFLKNIHDKNDDRDNLINEWYQLEELNVSKNDINKKYFVYLNNQGVLTIIDYEFFDNNFLFLNETGREITVLKIADDWEEENFGFIKYDMENGFYKVKDGKWFIMWRYKDDERGNRFFYVKEKNYEKKQVEFSDKKIIFVIYKNGINELYSFLNLKF